MILLSLMMRNDEKNATFLMPLHQLMMKYIHNKTLIPKNQKIHETVESTPSIRHSYEHNLTRYGRKLYFRINLLEAKPSPLESTIRACNLTSLYTGKKMFKG